MTKQKYLKRLNKALACLPREERKKALDYYNELIEDRVEAGFTEEAATAELGDVKSVAADIISDARERGVKMRFTGGWKALGIIGVIIFVPALLIAAAALLSRFEPTASFFERIGGEWQEHTETFELAEGDDLNAVFRDYGVSIGVSEDGLAHVTYYENDVTKFELAKNGSGLELSQKNDWKHSLLFWRKAPGAVILLPKGFNGDIAVSVSTGKMNVEAINTSGRMELTDATGDMSVIGCSAKALNIALSTGDLTVTDCRSDGDMLISNSTGGVTLENASADNGRIAVTSSTGDIRLANCTAGTVEAKLSTGDLAMASVTAGSVSARSSTGDITVTNCSSESFAAKLTTGKMKLSSVTTGSFSAESSTGDITLDGIDAKDVYLKATTGSIKGTLAGSIKDYSITSRVSTGKCNLPGELKLGERKLHAEASTGNIEISFADDND